MYSPETLSAKAAEAARDARNALIMSIVGLFCFGFIFGFFAYRKANDAIETIDIYDVARDKRGLATAAKVLAIVDIVFWGIGLLTRVLLR
jgi:hypothetical protein